MGKRKNKNQDRKKKISLVFDENKRKEFLCGFRKRKLERKKKAQEELQRMLKEEKRRIKQENKESYKKLIVSSRPIPDIEQLLQEEYEDDDVNVKIVELSADTLQKRDLVIGQNTPKETNIKKDTPKKKEKVAENIPGMGSDEESAEEESETEENEDENTKTKKEIKKMLKKQATKKIQKSKVFQMKSKLDRVKNKKKSQQKKGLKAKVAPRKDKSKKKIGRRKH
ncbi:nucleolar protein 12 [Ostrinia nubilalis]|uniref:nucleolar protein 12 n=1 Tax=Ostrinia furnacalis TaxID=93504 RepID=UPI00103C2B41|nr:nucleolar protein 12 [Ostrinia furnacalis]